jgi:hypothetical protein
MDSSQNGTFVTAYYDFPMNKSSALFLGPVQVNNSYACKYEGLLSRCKNDTSPLLPNGNCSTDEMSSFLTGRNTILTLIHSVVSLTLPIVDNNNRDIVLGYMTVVAAATSLLDVTTSRAGLADTGVVLLISPSRHENLFRYEQRPANAMANPPYEPKPGALDMARVKYVFPPFPNPGQPDRHTQYK